MTNTPNRNTIDYQAGFTEGHAKGVEEGKAEGLEEGREEGHRDGYDSGHADGETDGEHRAREHMSNAFDIATAMKLGQQLLLRMNGDGTAEATVWLRNGEVIRVRPDDAKRMAYKMLPLAAMQAARAGRPR